MGGIISPVVSILESSQCRVSIVELIGLTELIDFDLHAHIDEPARSPCDSVGRGYRSSRLRVDSGRPVAAAAD